ncbi:MAG: hypothetical protein AAF645_27855 [Myxococcota bacterium]
MKAKLLPVILLSTVVSSAAVYAQDPPGRGESAAPDSGGEESEAADADSREVNEGDSKVKVFRFSGLDISGRLKSPQLLYFLNRLRAEFDRPKLPHRSFLPEMERSTKTPSL